MRTILAVALFAGAARADDAPGWPQYGGPSRDFARPAVAQGVEGRAAGGGVWERELGPGASGVVCDGELLVTMYSVPDPKKSSEGDEVVVGLDRATGKTLWERRDPVARLTGQQSYSGDPIRPQATPAISGSRVCTLGYTGLLSGFDSATGKLAWRHDLVKDFAATPVQFGFAASPLAAGGLFVVHVGGGRRPSSPSTLRSARPSGSRSRRSRATRRPC